MRYAKRIATILALATLLGLGAGVGPAAARQVLPPHLKNVHCSRLSRLHGRAHDRHLLRDLCGKDTALYQRMYATVVGESHWQAGAHNASGASGYSQLMPGWWNGSSRWRFDPYNGALNLRVMYYMVKHPRQTGGWANWRGH